MTLTWMGRTDAGIERLEEALRRNPFPERCNLSYRQAARTVAQQERVAFLDVNELFREASRPDPRKAVALYLDWCHPTPDGHRLVAGALMREIRAAK
jgi:lysophospholipase L1-like esterase